MLSHIKTNDNHWTVIVDAQPHIFDQSHPEYDNLVECIRTGDSETFMRIVTVGTAIQNWSEGNFQFRDGFLYFEDEQVSHQPTARIISLIKAGWSVGPMLAYLSNLYENVSARAVRESYEWSTHRGLPITEDGMMVGYKGCAVYRGPEILDKNGRTLRDGDTVDRYTGKSHRNNVGDSPHMKRRQVCDDMTIGCSNGLHIGTYDYAVGWAGTGGRVVLVKFNPKDIVSVPSCCSFQKMRVSDYTVIAIAREELDEEVLEDEVLAAMFEDEQDDDEDEIDRDGDRIGGDGWF